MAYAHRALNSFAALPFISTWKTDNLSTGSSTDTQVKLPLVATGTYKFTVNWGDGNSDAITTWNQAQVTHTYAAIGTYTITITGFIKGWRISSATTSPTYSASDRLKLLTVQQWGCLRLNDLGEAFAGCENLTLLDVTDTFNFKGSVGGGRRFFVYCKNVTTINNINKWDTSKLTTLSGIFSQAWNFDDNIGNLNTSKVTDMSLLMNSSSININGTLFQQDGKFTNGGSDSIKNWDTSNVTLFNQIFTGQPLFNQPIGSWDTGKGTAFQFLFYAYGPNTAGRTAGIFNQPLGNWNTSNVTNMASVFYNQTLFDQNIGSWNTANVTDMQTMFDCYGGGSIAVTGIFNNGGSDSIKNWDTSKVTRTQAMFYNQILFNQEVGLWNMSNVTNMGLMFNAQAREINPAITTAFNNAGMVSINNWDTSKATTMNYLFGSSTSFNQPIGNWNVSLVTDFTNFMINRTNLTYSTANYDALLIGWASRPVKPSISINFGTIKYTAAASAARAILTSAPNNWTIADGGLQP